MQCSTMSKDPKHQGHVCLWTLAILISASLVMLDISPFNWRCNQNPFKSGLSREYPLDTILWRLVAIYRILNIYSGSPKIIHRSRRSFKRKIFLYNPSLTFIGVSSQSILHAFYIYISRGLAKKQPNFTCFPHCCRLWCNTIRLDLPRALGYSH